jgi:hypothetical protein
MNAAVRSARSDTVPIDRHVRGGHDVASAFRVTLGAITVPRFDVDALNYHDCNTRDAPPSFPCWPST